MPSNKYDPKDNSSKSDSESQGIKAVCFETIHCLLRSNENVHHLFYYVLVLLEALQIFYYITHPLFPFYKNSQIMGYIHQCTYLLIFVDLKYIVFSEFLQDNPNLYQVLLPICSSYIVIQIILIFIIIKQIREKKLINQVKKIHLISNVLFLVFNSVLTIPFFGISLNTLYCDSQNNMYTMGIDCSEGAHIGLSFFAVFIIVFLVIQCGVNWYIYYNKNPFGTDFLSKYENNAVLGKFIIKILPIVYIAIDEDMLYIDIYNFGIIACLFGYLFFFRMFSYHDYNEINFYFKLFLEVIVAWFALNNIVYIYIDTDGDGEGLIQSFLCSIVVALLVLQIQEEGYKKIFLEGMQSQKIKKQNIEKFLYRLIFTFSHSQSEDEKNHLQTVVKILSSKFHSAEDLSSTAKSSKKLQKKFHAFLSRFLEEYLQGASSIMLMAVNCNLLIFEQKFSFAFHQSLELSNKKITTIEQLMMYRFRRHPRYDREKLDTIKKQNNNIFMMYYDFNQNLMRLEQEINQCAINNLDYWEQVCEPNPSIYKVRNLAEKYEKYQQSIDKYYNKIYEIFPNNKLALKSYIDFLIYVGVNIRSLAKGKQRYQQAEQNLKKTKELQRDSGNLIQMGENQNLGYISVQTSELNLGNVINCNSQFKRILGYEKHELVDKKIYKMMPKSFNEFHDGVVRNYINKKEHNEKNKVQRVVYALSKQNFLIEVVLFTKVNYKTIGEKPGLELIGFLKKIEDPNKAVIIIQINSSSIMGANAGFSKIIEDGINNAEFINSQIKVCTLLPNLNLSDIDQSKAQQTELVFSSTVIVTKSGLSLQVKKKVLVEVQQVRQYSSKLKFAYLTLKQLQSEANQIRNSNRLVKPAQQNHKFSENNSPSKESSRKVKVLSSQVSIMEEYSNEIKTFDEDNYKLPTQSQEKQSEVYHMIERKKDEFLKNQHLEIFRYVLWFILIFLVVSTIGVYIFYCLINYQMVSISRQVLNEVKNSYVITYQTGLINKYIQRVMAANLYTLDQFNANSQLLNTSIMDFQNNFIPLMTQSVGYNYPLELNQFNYYDVVIQIQNGQPIYSEQTIIDAFFQYLSTAKNFAAYQMNQIIVNSTIQLVQQNQFVQYNGRQLFPKIEKNMSLQFLSLGSHFFQNHAHQQTLINISYAVNLIVMMLLIAILIRKINSFNEIVVTLYNQIRLWDASEMKSKCYKFIEKSSAGSIKSQSKRRISSILNVFPQQTFIKIIEPLMQKTVLNSNQSKLTGSVLNNSNQQDQLLKIQRMQTTDQPKQIIESRASQRQRRFHVQLEEKNKLKSKFIVFVLIICIFITGQFLFDQYSSQYQSRVTYYQERVSQLGKVRNNLAFIGYYTYQVMLDSNNSIYMSLLDAEIQEFFNSTNDCYDLIGDPSMILKDSYSVIEQITALVFSKNLTIPDSERFSINNSNYLLEERLFNSSINSINVLIDESMTNEAEDLFSSIQTINLIFTLVQVFLIVSLAIAIKCFMLEEILKNSKKSKSMILMLPPWLIDRNKGISQIFK